MNSATRRVAGCLLAVVAGCGGADSSGGGEAVVQAAAPAAEPPPAAEAAASPPADTVPPAASGGEWTASIVETALPSVGMTTLTEVRTARHPEFDRVVFQFAGDTLPRYRAEYVDRPVRQCGSGEPVQMAGDGWLAISLSPARAHDDQGRATVRERARQPGFPVLRDLRLTCDFEGQVEWVLGVASPNRFRILELSDPARLVVDVRR